MIPITHPFRKVREKDRAPGNVTCFAYDGIHRKTTVTHPSGAYASSTPTKCFLYEASIDGKTVNYPTGRLAEAYTTTSACSKTTLPPVVTDEAFGYSQRGDLTDVYESTPDSNGYYHTTASYWANGALSALTGVPSHSGWTFGVDTEGRPNSALDGSTILVPVNGVAYNAASQPTGVSLGSGDSDTYTYYPTTGRMWTYQYNIGSTPKYVTGTLGWNPNGSLGSLVIADAFYSADAQTCGYSADDLARLQSVSCGPTSPNGTTWGQTFSYDPFGNITKSVPTSMTGIAWQPGYNMNNQYTLGGTSYDGNGNLTADTFNTYAWDSDANTVGMNLSGSAPITITYDAFDRVVEENNSGTYKEILYSPIGKLALMAKQITNNVFLPLPGGEQATYTNSTIRFRHYDWLGSARFESSMAENLYGEVAYAPFGETESIKNTPYLSFTGQNQDTISGTYDFLHREYNPTQGRWISPDPAGLGAVALTNPQTWNRYAYVGNNPLSNVDPMGLCEASQIWTHICHGSRDDTDSNGANPVLGLDEFDLVWYDPMVAFYGINRALAEQVRFATYQAQVNCAFYGSDCDKVPGPSQGDLQKGYQKQLNATVAAIKNAGVHQEAITAFIAANPFSTSVQLAGGNFDFANPLNDQGNPIISLDCGQTERCDQGAFGTLDFSHNDGTFHLDTADPYNIRGALEHFAVDIVLGNIWYYVIPRPWP